MPEHRRLCTIVGDQDDPVVAVRYEPAWRTKRHAGLMVITSSAPAPDDADDEDYTTFCLHCLEKRHPEAKRGLTLAKAYGHAFWDEEGGEWIAEDEAGNEVVFDSGDDPLEEAER